MTPNRLNELFYYDKENYRIKKRKNNAPVFPDENSSILLWDPVGKKLKRYKIGNAAWILITKEAVPTGYKVLHKNLDTKDIKLNNLTLVTEQEYNDVRAVYRNLNGALTVKQHKKDQYCHVVTWYNGKYLSRKVYCDIADALRLERIIKLKSLKVLTKYCVFD